MAENLRKLDLKKVVVGFAGQPRLERDAGGIKVNPEVFLGLWELEGDAAICDRARRDRDNARQTSVGVRRTTCARALDVKRKRTNATYGLPIEDQKKGAAVRLKLGGANGGKGSGERSIQEEMPSKLGLGCRVARRKAKEQLDERRLEKIVAQERKRTRAGLKGRRAERRTGRQDALDRNRQDLDGDLGHLISQKGE